MSGEFVQIAPSFGARLRTERLRLDMNQTEFAEMAGIQRLAQSQYESEARVPTVRYLTVIAKGGVNLYYLLFNKKEGHSPLPQKIERELEKQAFDLVEEYVRVRCGGMLSSDGRFVLFEILRAHLIRAAISGVEVDMSILDSLVAS